MSSTDMRKILEQVNRALEGSSPAEEQPSVLGLKTALSDAIMSNSTDTQLQQDLYRAIHAVLDNHFPGWDYDG